jgi:hypothetical protein
MEIRVRHAVVADAAAPATKHRQEACLAEPISEASC